ncbi:uncharacterized protein HKW66_Vig0241060 [Vigna angularis]|uniref:Uncharacterized protein n=1 Tax=Phaseolus angularis TaxID=3914 RepID=A0A8T0JI91_PHAAN|nr:uncharacterized protein HKW66_Vig0241060 [Vigna angularis]
MTLQKQKRLKNNLLSLSQSSTKKKVQAEMEPRTNSAKVTSNLKGLRRSIGSQKFLLFNSFYFFLLNTGALIERQVLLEFDVFFFRQYQKVSYFRIFFLFSPPIERRRLQGWDMKGIEVVGSINDFHFVCDFERHGHSFRLIMLQRKEGHLICSGLDIICIWIRANSAGDIPLTCSESNHIFGKMHNSYPKKHHKGYCLELDFTTFVYQHFTHMQPDVLLVEPHFKKGTEYEEWEPNTLSSQIVHILEPNMNVMEPNTKIIEKPNMNVMEPNTKIIEKHGNRIPLGTEYFIFRKFSPLEPNTSTR